MGERIITADKARALREAATPGPWRSGRGRWGDPRVNAGGVVFALPDGGPNYGGPNHGTAALIAAAPDLAATVEALERHLRDLLARIHRDGGHHAAEVGIERAAEQADVLVAEVYAERDELLAERDDLRAEVERLRRVVALEHGDDSAALPGWHWNPHAQHWWSDDGLAIWRGLGWRTWLGRIKQDYGNDCPVDLRRSKSFPTVWDAMNEKMEGATSDSIGDGGGDE